MIVSVLTAAALAVGSVAAAPTAEIPIAQLCAATGIDQVDQLLSSLSTGDLTGALAPLASLTVPKNADSVQLAGVVQLSDVRRALNCDPTTATVTPTATPTPTTTATPKPPKRLPRHAAETGGGPAA